MLVNPKYNPERLLVYYNRESCLELFKKNPKTYEWWKNAKVKDVFEKIQDGIYEYYDCNDPQGILDESIHLCDCEHYKSYNRAKAINASYRHRVFKNVLRENPDNQYIHYPYGLCNSYKDILTRCKGIDYFINHKTEKYIIVLCDFTHLYDDPDFKPWKWGRDIGKENTGKKYHFAIYRVYEKKNSKQKA